METDQTLESIALGSFLKHRRDQMRETIRDVAHRAELSKSYIAYIEKGKRPHPSVQTIQKLAQGYRVETSVIQRLALGMPGGDQLSRSAALENTLRRIDSLPESTQVELWHLIDALVTHRERL